MQLNRMFEMVYLLMQHGQMKAGDLAARFEVSVRTIFRDVDVLSGAGIPIYAKKGRGGGIALLPGFVLDKSVLTEQDQAEILFALKSIHGLSGADSSEMMGRLSALFQKEAADWIDVDFSRWGSSQEEKAVFQLLKEAILTRKVVRFTYYNSNGEMAERRVEPVKLTFKNAAWYLQGYCLLRRAFRTFKVCRMNGLAVLEEHFLKREAPPPLEITIENSRPMEKMALLFSQKAAFRVYDEFPFAQIKKQKDGKLLVKTYFLEGKWSYGYFLSFGKELQVLAPLHVKEKMIQLAQEIVEGYFA